MLFCTIKNTFARFSRILLNPKLSLVCTKRLTCRLLLAKIKIKIIEPKLHLSNTCCLPTIKAITFSCRLWDYQFYIVTRCTNQSNAGDAICKQCASVMYFEWFSKSAELSSFQSVSSVCMWASGLLTAFSCIAQRVSGNWKTINKKFVPV